MKKVALFLLIGVFYLGHADQAYDIYYVYPTGDPSKCPTNGFPCHSLQDYADNSSFTVNRMFNFLEGEHYLETIVSITNVNRLSLTAIHSTVEIYIYMWKSSANLPPLDSISGSLVW